VSDWSIENVEVEKMFVNPATAKEWLEATRLKNRKQKEKNLRQLTMAMKNGTFRFNGESVVFAAFPYELCDGQHRLEAIVRSGVGQWLVVVRGIDPSVFPTFDSGAGRSDADTLGIDGERSTFLLAAAANTVWRMRQGRLDAKHMRLSRPELLAFVKENPQLRDAILLIHRSRGLSALAQGSFLAAAAVAMIEKNGLDITSRFFSLLATDTGHEEGDPILAARRRFLHARQRNERLEESEVISLTIRAFNAWLANRPMHFGRVRTSNNIDGERRTIVIPEVATVAHE
jgi:hypothetical protein